MMPKPLYIGIIAGEPSGDFLGAGLIEKIQELHPSAKFVGIGGPLMRTKSLQVIYPMEHIAVMGITDVLKCYPRLRWIHYKISQYFLRNKPDVFIGIDAPDFNLPIELQLKKIGIKTVHYVSPKVWAWRKERVYTIKAAVDLLLSVFPFEEAFYKPYDVHVKYIGHPLADIIALSPDVQKYRNYWKIEPEQEIIAVLPGSRMAEMKHMGPLFLDAMHLIQQRRPHTLFIIPFANVKLLMLFKKQMKKKQYHLNLRLVEGVSREAMGAANLVITKAGTSTLEAALLKKSMVVAFKMSHLTYRFVAPRVQVNYCSLPNLLLNKPLVPELIQNNAQASHIAESVFNLLENLNTQKHIQMQFTILHQQLSCQASSQAAKAVLSLAGI